MCEGEDLLGDVFGMRCSRGGWRGGVGHRCWGVVKGGPAGYGCYGGDEEEMWMGWAVEAEVDRGPVSGGGEGV